MDANRVREFRKARGLSTTELAYRIGRSTTALHQYETGLVDPPLPVARLLAHVLGQPLDAVFPDRVADDPSSIVA